MVTAAAGFINLDREVWQHGSMNVVSKSNSPGTGRGEGVRKRAGKTRLELKCKSVGHIQGTSSREFVLV